jgi:hypothetical protein
MIFKLRKCPCCFSLNIVLNRNSIYENNYKNFLGWKLKEKFNCRKCKEEVGLFIEEKYNLKKLIWLNGLKCEENYYDQLFYLEERQSLFSNQKNQEYFQAQNKIRNIKRQIIKERNNIKIKNKVDIPLESVN